MFIILMLEALQSHVMPDTWVVSDAEKLQTWCLLPVLLNQKLVL